MNNLSNLTVIIVTYKTDIKILKDCINSIDPKVKIKIVENSNQKKIFSSSFVENERLSITCSGKNLGYGVGNNFGFNLVDTDYAIVANPDIIFNKNFFENIDKYLQEDLDFTVIGSTYQDESTFTSSGLFKENEKKQYEKNIVSKSGKLFSTLVKVDWVTGCMMLINLKKFETKKIFDESFFLYFEEFDLCKRIEIKKENVFCANDLLIDHLGYKGSFGADPNLQLESEKLREWHWMWSTFYFYKKNFGYFFSLKKTIGKLIRAFLKFLFYTIILNNKMKSKYKCRFFGLLNSMMNKKSWYRVNSSYQ